MRGNKLAAARHLGTPMPWSTTGNRQSRLSVNTIPQVEQSATQGCPPLIALYLYMSSSQQPPIISLGPHPLQNITPGDIGGLAGDEAKQQVAATLLTLTKDSVFGNHIGRRIRLISVDVEPKTDEPRKIEAKVVTEITVEQGRSLQSISARFRKQRLTPVLDRYGQRSGNDAWWMHSIPYGYVSKYT